MCAIEEFAASSSGSYNRGQEIHHRAPGKEPMGESSVNLMVPIEMVHLFESDSSRNASEVIRSVSIRQGSPQSTVNHED